MDNGRPVQDQDEYEGRIYMLNVDSMPERPDPMDSGLVLCAGQESMRCQYLVLGIVDEDDVELLSTTVPKVRNATGTPLPG